MTHREANQKTEALEAEILSTNKTMEEAIAKKKAKWLEIKDFGVIDAVAADRGFKYMKELTSEIETCERVIRKAFKKIDDIKEQVR